MAENSKWRYSLWPKCSFDMANFAVSNNWTVSNSWLHAWGPGVHNTTWKSYPITTYFERDIWFFYLDVWKTNVDHQFCSVSLPYGCYITVFLNDSYSLTPNTHSTMYQDRSSRRKIWLLRFEGPCVSCSIFCRSSWSKPFYGIELAPGPENSLASLKRVSEAYRLV